MRVLGLPAVRVPAWLRRPCPSASPPEASASTGRRPRRAGAPSCDRLRGALAAALLALPLLMGLAAGAQAQDLTLVSNADNKILDGARSSGRGAQSFTTGSYASGYLLTSVGIHVWDQAGSTPAIVATIREDKNGNPGDIVATLTNPDRLRLRRINTFTAPANTRLAASTKYWLAVNESSKFDEKLGFSLTNDKTETGQTGWSIDNRKYRSAGKWFGSPGRDLVIEIKGTLAPPAAPTGLTATAGDGQVTLNWTDPSNSVITGYQYRTRVGRGLFPWANIPGSTATTTSHTVTGLTNGTDLEFRVRALAGTTAGAVARTETVTPLDSNAPQAFNFSVSAGPRSVTLSWSGLPGNNAITRYQYRTKVGGNQFPWANIPGGASARTFTVKNLTKGTPHEFQMRAVAGTILGAASSVRTATPLPQPPDAVAGFTATVGDRSVVVSWTKPDNEDITGYERERRVAGGNWMSRPSFQDPNTRIYIEAGLVNGTEYQFRVRAVAGTVKGKWSATATATPLDPNAPKAFSFRANVGAGSVILRWAGPDSREDVTEYQYRRGTGDPVAWGAWTDIPSAADGRFTVRGLTGGTQYSFQMRAVAGTILGAASSVKTATPRVQPPPAALAGLTATEGNGVVVLKWTDPDNGDITGYQYQTRSAGGGWLPADPVGSDGKDFTIGVADLDNGTEYEFRVRAVIGTVEGAWSFVTATPLDPNAAPKPTGLTATAGNGEVTLNWTDPKNSNIGKYQVRQGTGDPVAWGNWTDIASSSATTTSHTVTGLTNDAGYSFQVRVVVGTVFGAASSAVTAKPSGPPAAPANLRTSPADGQARLSWNLPSNSAITKHQIRQGTGNPFAWGEWTDIPADDLKNEQNAFLIYLVTGLTNGTEYSFQIRAVAGTVAGTASATVTATPLATTAPAAPDSFRVTPGDNQVTLSWADPSNNAITKYQVRQGTGSPLAWGAWTDIPNSGAGTTSHTVTGLTGGTRYSFQVRAVAGTVFGAATSTLSRVPFLPRPAAPVLTATAGDARVTLTWADPGDASIDKAQYAVRVAGADWPQGSAPIPSVVLSARTFSVTRLLNNTTFINGTDYEFRMRFENARGTSDWSDTASATPVAATAAAAPTGFTATAGNGQVDLAWTAPSGTITKYQVRQGTGDPLVWGAWADITGTTSHTVTGLTGGTQYSFQVRAVAGTVLGRMSAAASATPAAAANAAPVVANAISDRQAPTGQAFRHQFPANTFTDADDDPLTYTAARGDDSALPDWLSFAAATRTFTGTPASGDAGTLTVKVTADDGNGGTASDSFDIEVAAAAATVQFFGATSKHPEDPALTQEPATVVLSETVSDPVDVYITAAGGTATKGDDYAAGTATSPGGAAGTYKVTIPAGDISADLTPDITDDAAFEGDETFTLTIVEVASDAVVGLGSRTTHTATIEDSENGLVLTPAYTGTPIALTEAAGAGRTHEFTVALAARPTADVTVSMLLIGLPGAATVAPGSLTFTGSDWSTAKTVTITAADNADDIRDGYASIFVLLSISTADSRFGSGQNLVARIADDDPTTVTLSADAGDVVEGGTKDITITLGRSLIEGEALPVALTFGGGAERDGDGGRHRGHPELDRPVRRHDHRVRVPATGGGRHLAERLDGFHQRCRHRLPHGDGPDQRHDLRVPGPRRVRDGGRHGLEHRDRDPAGRERPGQADRPDGDGGR